VDRCALFVDAGYLLADGAMAVHGTRRRESVSWDYSGMLQLLASLAQERSGLPLLRCYWYEATVEGRRNADHDTLADLPGVKLRVAKMRPGRREGVEGEIHRDLTALARNKAVSDAMVVSAEEDLAQVVADVQDLGLRVTLLHIVVDGNWTVSRTLRQECDDIVEITSAHLRPYVELISGAEPPRPDERDGAALIALRPAANGHGPAGRTAAYVPAAAGTENGYQAPPSIYTAPVVAEYQRSAPQLSRSRPDDPAAREDSRAGESAAAQELPARPDLQPVRTDADAQREPLDAPAEPTVAAPDYLVGQEPATAQPDPAPAQQQEAQSAMQDYAPRPEMYAAPVAVPVAFEEQSIELPATRSRQAADLSGYAPGAIREAPGAIREQLPREAGNGLQSVPAAASTAQIRHLPTRGGGQPAAAPGHPAAGPPPTTAAPALPASAAPPPGPGQQVPGQQATGPQAMGPQAMGPQATGPQAMGQPLAGQPAIGQPAVPGTLVAPGTGYAAARNGSYSGPRPVVPVGAPGPAGPVGLSNGQPGGSGAQPGPAPVAPLSPAGPAPVGAPGQGTMGSAPAGPAAGPVGPAAYSGAQSSVSLAEAVQSAHEEGQTFGESVARDAPALWLEAVLARKPRMPSDLEARLLQGSSLPIDFLLHDEVRHALRRGFWDALERARR
jgi:hypothetical protein